MNIVYEQSCVWLHQKQYITLMLRKFGLADANPVPTVCYGYSIRVHAVS